MDFQKGSGAHGSLRSLFPDNRNSQPATAQELDMAIRKDRDEYDGPVNHEGEPRRPASDITAKGGVYQDAEGYHDADGNRLSDEEAERRLTEAEDLRDKRAGADTGTPSAAPAAREANPPGRTEPGIAGTEAAPENIKSVQEARDAAAEDARKVADAERESHTRQSEEERRKDAAAASGGAAQPPKAPGATTPSTARPAPATRSTTGLTAEQLEEKDKGELAALADRKGVTVTRGDGAEGEPLKSDYVKALTGK